MLEQRPRSTESGAHWKETMVNKEGFTHRPFSRRARRLYIRGLAVAGLLSLLIPGEAAFAARRLPFPKERRGGYPPADVVFAGQVRAGSAAREITVGDGPALEGSVLEWALTTGTKNSRSYFYAHRHAVRP